jgi:hypothetical protein
MGGPEVELVALTLAKASALHRFVIVLFEELAPLLVEEIGPRLGSDSFLMGS